MLCNVIRYRQIIFIFLIILIALELVTYVSLYILLIEPSSLNTFIYKNNDYFSPDYF
jgi:hypothetical protein